MENQILEKVLEIAQKTIGNNISGTKAMSEIESFEWHKKHARIDSETGNLIISADEIGDGSYEKYINESKKYLETKNAESFDKYIDGKWHYFEGYEYGAVSVRFRKIYLYKDIYVFDGDMISWATVDSRFDGNGIIINEDCEGISFSTLPYSGGPFSNKDVLVDFIENFYGNPRDVQTDDEIKESIYETMDNLLGDILD